MRKWHRCKEIALNLSRNNHFIPGAVSARGSVMTHLSRMPFQAIRITGPVVRAA